MARISPRSPVVACAAAFVVAVAPPSARADEDDQEEAEEPDAAAALDGLASPGPILRAGPLRPEMSAFPLRACSFRKPLCVSAPRTASPADVLATLASAESAWDTATGALDLPAPDADLGTGAYDIYLDGRGARTALSTRDVRSRVDRASAFTTIDPRLRGCSRDRAVAKELFRAILFRVAPAIDEGSARAQSGALASLVAPCAAVDTSLFQAHPERPLVDTWPDAPPDVGVRFGEGASIAFDFVDASYAAEPGGVIRALWALSPSRTALGAWRWANEPDTFDVLRASLKNAVATGSTVDDLFREIAVARAREGTERLAWSIDWPSTPRRLSSPAEGIGPTGSSYVAIRRAGAPAGARLRLEAAWEQHCKMRWAVVKLDAAGREIGHLPVPTTDRTTEVQMTIVDLDQVATILVVATNAGDPSYPFDPDDEVWEPHGWLLTLAAE